ncbi:MAG: metal ABC transporter ATP-binding protein [Deltaproteobacteria bacterium]|nr:metal ABC transporter ATP-binding protein [Deltaproteobacteria bacterium]
MTTDSVQVRVEKVDFSYEATHVLIEVDLTITQGDFLAIIGPNGSGKSTLLKVILGLLPVQQGNVIIFGQDLAHFSQWSKIGYVPQKAAHSGVFFPASVEEVVAMGLLSKKKFPKILRHRDKESVEKALERVNMNDFRRRRIGELSGGQQQRIFIARAIVNEPEILFLDEPTAGVDAETQQRFYEMLDMLNKDHDITIVMVTHDVGIVTKHVNKVACLNQRLVFHGTHDEFCSSSVVQDILKGEHHLVCHRH